VKAKATHQGECQVCGSRQMLPDGLLSIHGYTVEYSFFQGVCYGAKHLPFEQDKSLIEQAILNAKRILKDTVAEIGTLRTGLGQKAWFHVYVTKQTRRGPRNQYEWMYLDVITKTDSREASETYYTHYYQHAPVANAVKFNSIREEWNNAHAYDSPEFPLVETIRQQNAGYIKMELDPTVKRIETYIKWQQDRIKNWSVKPLSPVGDVKAIADPTILKIDGGWIETYQKAGGRYGAYQKPAFTITPDRSKAKVFTKRAASIAQGPLFRFKIKTQQEAW
jgi:hypothetical protein